MQMEICQTINFNVTDIPLKWFQVFSKDREGCIPPEELKFVLANLPNNVGFLQTYQTMKPFKESTIINILLGLETNVRWKTFL